MVRKTVAVRQGVRRDAKHTNVVAQDTPIRKKVACPMICDSVKARVEDRTAKFKLEMVNRSLQEGRDSVKKKTGYA